MRIGNNIVEYTTYELPTHKYKEINIHELANKCKEWALEQGYELRTSTKGIIDVYNMNYNCEFIDSLNYRLPEPQTVFKYCEWILKQKAKS